MQFCYLRSLWQTGRVPFMLLHAHEAALGLKKVGKPWSRSIRGDTQSTQPSELF